MWTLLGILDYAEQFAKRRLFITVSLGANSTSHPCMPREINSLGIFDLQKDGQYCS